MAPLISHRFRDFLEDHAPRHAQYIEVKFTGPQSLMPAQAYYAVNWLCVVDCIDFQKSEYEDEDPPTNDPERYDYWRTILDPSKVPPETRIFRLKYQTETVAIDADLAKEIERAGITGPQFYRIDYSIADEMR